MQFASKDEIHDVRIELVSLIHSMDPDHFPEERPHAFAYHIKMTNNSNETVVLDARKWILKYEDGSTEVFEGNEIVGKIVRLSPAEFFEYSSYHLVEQNCCVTGSYHGHSDSKANIWVRIPKFHLHIPKNLE